MAGTVPTMAPGPRPPRAPAPDSLERYRAGLARRRSLLARRTPRAIELTAESLHGAHELLSGAVGAVSGVRNPRYMRDQLLGERALPLEDVAALALEAPRAALAVLLPIVRAAGGRLVPASPLARSIPEAAAQLEAAQSRFSAGMLRALADGVVDAAERRALAAELDHLQRRLAEADRSLACGATP